MRPIAFERGADWQVSYFTGLRAEPRRGRPGDRRRRRPARVLGAWHDHQLDAPLARGYSGAIAQKVNAPYVWLPLCLLFLAPVLRPAPPASACSTSTCSCCSGSASRCSSSTAARSPPRCRSPIRCWATSSCGCSWSGFRPRERAGPARAARAGPLARRSAAVVLAVRPDRAQRRRLARDRHRRRRRRRRRPHHPWPGALRGRLRARASGSAATSTGRSTTSPTCRSRRPSRGTATGATCRPPTRRRSPSTCSRRSASLALGRRLRAGPDGQRARGRARVRLARLPVHALHDERERQRLADRGDGGGGDARPGLAAGAGRRWWRSAPRRSSARRRWRRCSPPAPASAAGARRSSSRSRSWSCARSLVLPFLPDGGLREFYDRTLGYQASRSSPFSVWGLAPSLDFLRPVVRAGAVVAGVRGGAVAARARRRSRSPRWRRRC